MILKKINAVTAILSVFALLAHMGYNAYLYLSFSYNETVSGITTLLVVVFVCIHAVCGMCSVFLLGDGTRLDNYRKQNKGVILQRVSAALIFPLLIIHMKTFDLLKNSAEKSQWFLFGLLIFIQILFYAVVLVHIATSFSKAFITLGVLSDRNKQKILDRLVYVFCTMVLVFMVVAVVRGQLILFLPK